MTEESLIFIVNPGSASRKYALFKGGKKVASIHFEFVDGKVVGCIEHHGEKRTTNFDDPDLKTASRHVMSMLREFKAIHEGQTIAAIGLRIVAPSRRFMQDEIISEELENALNNLHKVAPLHIGTALTEIKELQKNLPGIPIVAISDSAFHSTKTKCAWYYGFDTGPANRLGILRYGYHGISVGSVVRNLKDQKMLLPKTIICHLGSGSSITAVGDGKSVDTSMGYSPLEGVMMSTRSGTIDISAALAIKRDLNMDDSEIEAYLFKKSGLLGVSGSSDDIRQLLSKEVKGDERAKLALEMFVYRVQQSIGQMAASMNGVNCLVFTGTVGERSIIIRNRILKNLGYLGFEVNSMMNKQTFEPTEVANIADHESKPILVISTDEAAEIARRTEKYINKK